LIELSFLGIDNILALRGDNRKGDSHFEPEINGSKNALDLIHQIQNMNAGIYLDEEISNSNESNFCTGAACYPEKQKTFIKQRRGDRINEVWLATNEKITEYLFDDSIIKVVSSHDAI
jgi:5,10-methylenetetrahydrofolate reductase